MALRPGSKASIDKGGEERARRGEKGEVGRIRMIPAMSSLEVHYTKYHVPFLHLRKNFFLIDQFLP